MATAPKAHGAPLRSEAGSEAGTRLSELAEPLASVSLWHLRPATRELLRHNALSVNAYPTEFGGLVYIGAPRHRMPVEVELHGIARLAERAGIAWLLFDAEAPILEGLPVFISSDTEH